MTNWLQMKAKPPLLASDIVSAEGKRPIHVNEASSLDNEITKLTFALENYFPSLKDVFLVTIGSEVFYSKTIVISPDPSIKVSDLADSVVTNRGYSESLERQQRDQSHSYRQQSGASNFKIHQSSVKPLHTVESMERDKIYHTDMILAGTVVGVHQEDLRRDRELDHQYFGYSDTQEIAYDILLTDGSIDFNVKPYEIRSTCLPSLLFQPSNELKVTAYPYYHKYRQLATIKPTLKRELSVGLTGKEPIILSGIQPSRVMNQIKNALVPTGMELLTILVLVSIQQIKIFFLFM